MIEWIVFLLIILCCLIWNYSQSSPKYTLSQIMESQIPMQLTKIWEERSPVVISDIRSNGIWVSDALKQTRFWGAQPIWEDYQTSPETAVIFQNRPQQTTWSEILGIQQIESDTLTRWFDLSPVVFHTKTEAHLGGEGLRSTYGWATAFTCTDGESRCILLHSAQKAKMPPGWKGLRWSNATVADHPLWTQVKYIEVILRPGTTLLVPPHWIVAIEPQDPKKPIWWLRTDLHHPISRGIQMINERE